MSSFEEYANEQYPAALAKIAESLEEPPLRELEMLAIRIMHVLEREQIELPNTPRPVLFRGLVAKACNEARAFVACCRIGSTWAAMHHARALMEVFATTHHLVCDPADAGLRLRRFVEFGDLARYKVYLRAAAGDRVDEVDEVLERAVATAITEDECYRVVRALKRANARAELIAKQMEKLKFGQNSRHAMEELITALSNLQSFATNDNNFPADGYQIKPARLQQCVNMIRDVRLAVTAVEQTFIS